MLQSRIFGALCSLLLFTSAALGDELRVATLNAYLCFKPGSDTGGQLEDKGPSDLAIYDRKIENLASLVQNVHFVGLQEIGSSLEPADMAKHLRGEHAFVQGKDTYTGQDVAAVFRLPPGYKVVKKTRVPELDKRLSKHMLVAIQGPTKRFNILVVHLLVPKKNDEKNALQRAAISAWMSAGQQREPQSVFIALGDFNENVRHPVLSVGTDALEQIGFPYTHSRRLCLDRIVVAGPAQIQDVTVSAPPYGPRPNDLNRMLWSDHFALSATITTE